MKRNIRKTKMKNSKKSIIIFKLKRNFFLLIILFFIGGVILNSSRFNGYKNNIYASMKDQYIQKEEKSVNTEISYSLKNYTLTVDTDLTKASNISSDEIDRMLEGTNLYGLGKAFVEAEEKYNVNALYMVGLACLESNYGTSSFAINRNNLYGWNAIDSNPQNASYFKSKEEATLYVASKLQTNYLTEGGAYHEEYTPRSVDVHYCTDKQHADKIVNIVEKLVKKLG